MLAIPPRYWQGWEIEDDLLVWHLFRDLLPAPVQDHHEGLLARLAAARPADRAPSSIRRAATPSTTGGATSDWRGRASFFRDGYNFAVSTQNFNHTAAMGALLGGAMIDV